MMFKLVLAAALCLVAAADASSVDTALRGVPARAIQRKLLTKRSADPLADPSNGSCDCVGSSCQCCEHVSSKKIVKFDDTVCLNATYDKEAIEVDLDVTLNGKEVYEKTVGLSDLTKICFGIPLISKLASGCLEFDDLIINTTYVGAEVEFVVLALGKSILHVDLGHIHFHP